MVIYLENCIAISFENYISLCALFEKLLTIKCKITEKKGQKKMLMIHVCVRSEHRKCHYHMLIVYQKINKINVWSLLKETVKQKTMLHNNNKKNIIKGIILLFSF